MTNDLISRLFVYGTLRRDPRHQMFHLLAKHARFIGEATVAGRLFDLGEYPGMISSDESNRVVGEVYQVDPSYWDQVIARLDEYEGCSPNDPEPREYRREIVNAELATGESLHAWAYVLNHWPSELREIKSGDYMSWLARV